MKFYGDEDEKDIFQTNESFSYRLSLIERYRTKGRLLDIGCATGGFLRAAQRKGWQVYGVELSDYAYGFAVKRYGLNVFRGNLEEAKFLVPQPLNFYWVRPDSISLNPYFHILAVRHFL